MGWYLAYGTDFVAAGAVTRRFLWAGEYWRAPTTIIVHGGLTHMLLNCIGILVLGPLIARGLGGVTFLAAVFFSGMAGLGLSLLTHESYTILIGISGGVMGLLGVILAIEWRQSVSVMDFFRRRNTRVVIFIVALNAILAIGVESFSDSINIDHAAHIGGMAFGLIGALALLGKTRRRPLRGLVVGLIFGLGPVAYAAYPYWDVEFFRFRTALARRDNDEAAERTALARWNQLKPGNHEVAGRLAVLDDDPSLLEGLGDALADNHKRAFIQSCLRLARRRLTSDPQAARALVDRAREVDLKDPVPWLLFAKAAEIAEQPEMAALAQEKAALAGGEFQGWEAAGKSLSLHRRRLDEADLSAEELVSRAIAAARATASATGGLGEEIELARRVGAERAVVDMAKRLTVTVLKLAPVDPPPEGLTDLYLYLVKIHRLLAENTPADERRPDYRLTGARWFWRAASEAGDPTEEQKTAAAALFRGALNEARDAKNGAVEAQAATWFEEHGLPVPAPDLDGRGTGD